MPLSAPGGRSSSTSRPGSSDQPGASRQRGQRPGQALELRLRLGCAAGVHRQRFALVLDPACFGARPRPSTAGSSASGHRQPGGRGRPGKATPFPSLPAVMSEHENIAVGRYASKGGCIRGRAAGDNRDRTRQRRRAGLARAVACGVALAAAGSATIGASVPSKSTAISARCGSAISAARPARPAAVVGVGSSADRPVVAVIAASVRAGRAHPLPPAALPPQPGNEHRVEFGRFLPVDQLVQ